MFTFIRQNSIDVLAGTLAHGIFACTVLQVHIKPGWLVTLLITVWIIYAIDHVLDTLNRDSVPLNPRHLPSGNTVRLITILVAIIADTILVFSIFTFRELWFPLALFCFVLIYVLTEKFITIRHYAFFPKEILIAAGYTAGIWIFPYSWMQANPGPDILLIPSSMMLLAFSNTLIYSYYEVNQDKLERRFSFSVYFGKKITRWVVLCCGVLIITAGVFFLFQGSSTIKMAGMILLIMSLGQIVITFTPKFFEQNYRYGIFNESLFLLPAMILLTP